MTLPMSSQRLKKLAKIGPIEIVLTYLCGDTPILVLTPSYCLALKGIELSESCVFVSLNRLDDLVGQIIL